MDGRLHVQSITVRSRSILGTLGGALQTVVGGNITAFTNLCEKAREEAFELMVSHATQMGANAIIEDPEDHQQAQERIRQGTHRQPERFVDAAEVVPSEIQRQDSRAWAG